MKSTHFTHDDLYYDIFWKKNNDLDRNIQATWISNSCNSNRIIMIHYCIISRFISIYVLTHALIISEYYIKVCYTTHMM
jgi:hypothetical protein